MFSYTRMCSLTIECVLLRDFGTDEAQCVCVSLGSLASKAATVVRNLPPKKIKSRPKRVGLQMS